MPGGAHPLLSLDFLPGFRPRCCPGDATGSSPGPLLPSSADFLFPSSPARVSQLRFSLPYSRPPCLAILSKHPTCCPLDFCPSLTSNPLINKSLSQPSRQTLLNSYFQKFIFQPVSQVRNYQVIFEPSATSDILPKTGFKLAICYTEIYTDLISKDHIQTPILSGSI